MGDVERALIAYAVLKGQLEKADLYEGLMVFFRPVTASLAGQLFAPDELAAKLGARYGLQVPSLVLASLAERMAKAGLLKKRAGINGAASYEYLASDLVVNNVSLPRVTRLLERFREFVRSQSTDFVELDDDALDDALFDRLLKIESLEILSRRDGLESPKQTQKTLTLKQKDHSSVAHAPVERHLDYIVSRFILNLQETDGEGFELLSDIASANLAAETVLTYREPPRRGEPLDHLEIYLDAPLCLDILGINPGREKYGAQFHQQLKRAGCRVNIFLHSISEIERILETRKLSYTSTTKPYDHFQVDPAQTRDLVNALAGYAEQTLTEQYGYNVVDSAEAVPLSRRISVGPEEEKAIRDQLVGWRNNEGREVDVATCCDLIRLRSGIELQTRILKAGPTLVTRNMVLARAANGTWRNWLREKNKGSRDRIKHAAPLAILDKQLTGLLWIAQGGSVGTLGRAHLVANCAAAVATRKDVITRVYNTLQGISPQSVSTFAALINDQRAERALMDATFSDPEVITDETVLPLLERIRIATAHEVESAKNLEIAELTKKMDRQSSEHEAVVAQLALERDAVAAMMSSAQDSLMEFERRDQERTDAMIRAAFRSARGGYVAIMVVVAVGLGLLTYWTQSKTTFEIGEPVTNSGIRWAVKWIVPGVISALSAAALAWEIPDLLLGGLRNRMSDWLFNYLLRRNGLTGQVKNYRWDFKSNNIELARANGLKHSNQGEATVLEGRTGRSR